MTKLIDELELNCCDWQRENTAHCDLKNNILTIGKCNFNKKQIKEIAFQFAHDIVDFADNGGDLQDMTAKSVYSLLNSIYSKHNN